MLSLQTSKDGHVRHVCFRCLNTFYSKESLASHYEYCKSYEAIKIELPEEGSKIYFNNHNKSTRVPFMVYADLESFTPQLSTCQPNLEKSYTNQYQKHIPADLLPHSVLMIYSILNNQLNCKRIFNDDDVAHIFIDTLEKNIKEIYDKFKFPKR